MEAWAWGWAAVQAMGTALLAIGIIFTVLQVYTTRESTRKNNTAQLSINVLHDFRDEETKDGLRFIYRLNPAEIDGMTDDEKHRIEGIMDKFQLLGTLIKQSIITGDLAIDLAPAALRCWYKLHEYIREQRKERGFFFEYFEGYTDYCLNYFHDTGFKVLFRREGDGENIDLVEELQKDDLRPRSYKTIEQDAKANRDK